MSSNSDTHNGDSKLTGGTIEDDFHSTSDHDLSDESDSDSEFDPNPVQTAKAEEYHGAKRDTKWVWISMIVVVVMIGGTTAIVLGFTNKFLLDEETAEFENGFRQHVSAVGEGTTFHAKTVVNYMESMAETITSYATASNAEWPYVTVPDYVRRGQRTIDEARFDMIAFSPIVDANQASNWSNFVSSQSIGSLYGNESAEVLEFSSEIHQLGNLDMVANDNSYVPFWMSSPMPHNISVVNLNLFSKSIFEEAFQSMKTSKKTVLSELYTSQINNDMVVLKDHVFPPGYFDGKVVKNNFGIPLNTEGNKQKKTDGVEEEAIDEIPHSIIMTPVYDSFRLDQRSLVGVVYGIVPWDRFFVGLLPKDVNGIIAVLKDTCGNRHSFVINGKETAYIGEGDVAGTNNAYISQNIDFASVFVAEDTKCAYSLSIYPSENFEALYYSDARATFLPFFASVFIGLGVGFLIFFLLVQRRQRRVVSVAQRTTAIVSELFPDNVRDRIMQQAEKQAKTEYSGGKVIVGDENKNLAELLENGRKQEEVLTTPRSSGGSSKRRLLRIPRSGGRRNSRGRSNDSGSAGNDLNDTNHTNNNDDPIADRYPECTVFFADIAGFTAWSSTRDPVEVFVLLEALYGAADKIARKMGVFKVETIGDCYVAVTGLPNARVDHAVVLARFASRFLVSSRDVFHNMTERLGEGTSKLDVRIGLHSGPVTAGVLRGEKSRFQLFGDTVNTAARMESNSRTGKIHCSKSTADLLIAGGKEHWLTEREDRIVAKGKGEMMTYFIDVPMADAQSRRSGGTRKSKSARSLARSASSGDDSSGVFSPQATPYKMGSKRGFVGGMDNVRGLDAFEHSPVSRTIPRVPSLNSDDMDDI